MKKTQILLALVFCLILTSLLAINILATTQPMPLSVDVQVSTEQELRAAFSAAPVGSAAAGTPWIVEITDDIEITGAFINLAAGRYVHLIGDYTISIAPSAVAENGMFRIQMDAHLRLDGPTLYGNDRRNFGINLNDPRSSFTMISGSIENFAQRGVRTVATVDLFVDLQGGLIANNGTGHSTVTGRSGVSVDGRLEHTVAGVTHTTTEQSRLYIHPGVEIRDNGMWGVWAYWHVNVEMTGGLITGNQTGVRLGGGTTTAGVSTFNMHGGEIVNNVRTTQGGGGVWVGHNGIFNMHDGLVAYNQSPAGAGVRVGGDGNGPGRMYMYGGVIRDNTATTDGGGIQVIGGPNRPLIGGATALAVHGGEIRDNFAGNNGGGVHLQSGQILFATHWPTMNFQGGYIFDNTAVNDGGGIWVNWTNRIFPGTGTAFRDLTIGENINVTSQPPNLFNNTSRQHYFITVFDRGRLSGHQTVSGERWFVDRHIILWNNDQINYAGNHELEYGVRQGQGTLTGDVTSDTWPILDGPLPPSRTAISGDEQIIFTAIPGLEYVVADWAIGVSLRSTPNAVTYFTQAEIEEMIENGYLAFEEDTNGVVRLAITNTTHLLSCDANLNYFAIYVFVYFEPCDQPIDENDEPPIDDNDDPPIDENDDPIDENDEPIDENDEPIDENDEPPIDKNDDPIDDNESDTATNNGGGGNGSSDTPKTGENNGILLWLSIGLTAALGMLLVVKKKAKIFP